MVRELRTAHETNRAPAPEAIDKLRDLATLIYQEGPLCVECHGQDMAFHTGPDESTEVNDLLQNIEMLQIYGALPRE